MRGLCLNIYDNFTKTPSDLIHNRILSLLRGGKEKLGANVAGAHLLTSWLIMPAKRPDDRADYCLGCSFLPSASTRYSFLHLGGVGRYLYGRTLVRARPNEHSQRTGLTSQRSQVIMSEFIEQVKLPSRIGKSELPNWNGEYFKNVNAI